ncbi:DUF4279 domain-containing protein [Paenibacillus phocaensis]|uniref:DUF4279 domain-containing protein n=1 Tax=Paenibacillus phocaensis TaxID=1776378 RepID=UPI000839C781|nr:DUF4279 domain-containing protein [Paenibacillus phocaensis]
MDKSNVMVEFIITGDELNPNLVTKKLGMNPHKYWVKGEAIQGKSITKKDSCWIISTGYEESLDINEQLDKVIEQISSKTQALKEIKAMNNLDFLFAIIVNVENNEKPSMYFNSKFIEFANDIKSEFYIDLYIY